MSSSNQLDKKHTNTAATTAPSLMASGMPKSPSVAPKTQTTASASNPAPAQPSELGYTEVDFNPTLTFTPAISEAESKKAIEQLKLLEAFFAATASSAATATATTAVVTADTKQAATQPSNVDHSSVTTASAMPDTKQASATNTERSSHLTRLLRVIKANKTMAQIEELLAIIVLGNTMPKIDEKSLTSKEKEKINEDGEKIRLVLEELIADLSPEATTLSVLKFKLACYNEKQVGMFYNVFLQAIAAGLSAEDATKILSIKNEEHPLVKKLFADNFSRKVPVIGKFSEDLDSHLLKVGHLTALTEQCSNAALDSKAVDTIYLDEFLPAISLHNASYTEIKAIVSKQNFDLLCGKLLSDTSKEASTLLTLKFKLASHRDDNTRQLYPVFLNAIELGLTIDDAKKILSIEDANHPLVLKLSGDITTVASPSHTKVAGFLAALRVDAMKSYHLNELRTHGRPVIYAQTKEDEKLVNQLFDVNFINAISYGATVAEVREALKLKQEGAQSHLFFKSLLTNYEAFKVKPKGHVFLSPVVLKFVSDLQKEECLNNLYVYSAYIEMNSVTGELSPQQLETQYKYFVEAIKVGVSHDDIKKAMHISPTSHTYPQIERLNATWHNDRTLQTNTVVKDFVRQYAMDFTEGCEKIRKAEAEEKQRMDRKEHQPHTTSSIKKQLEDQRDHARILVAAYRSEIDLAMKGYTGSLVAEAAAFKKIHEDTLRDRLVNAVKKHEATTALALFKTGKIQATLDAFNGGMPAIEKTYQEDVAIAAKKHGEAFSKEGKESTRAYNESTAGYGALNQTKTNVTKNLGITSTNATASAQTANPANTAAINVIDEKYQQSANKIDAKLEAARAASKARCDQADAAKSTALAVAREKRAQSIMALETVLLRAQINAQSILTDMGDRAKDIICAEFPEFTKENFGAPASIRNLHMAQVMALTSFHQSREVGHDFNKTSAMQKIADTRYLRWFAATHPDAKQETAAMSPPQPEHPRLQNTTWSTRAKK